MSLQTYQPECDPVGECYPVQPGDVGVHFLLGARSRRIPGYTGRIAAVLARVLFSRHAAQRIIGEPDVRNRAAIERLTRLGYEPGPEIDLPTNAPNSPSSPDPAGRRRPVAVMGRILPVSPGPFFPELDHSKKSSSISTTWYVSLTWTPTR